MTVVATNSSEPVWYSPSGINKLAGEYADLGTSLAQLQSSIKSVGAQVHSAAGYDSMGKQFGSAFQKILDQCTDLVGNVSSNVKYAAETLDQASDNAHQIDQDARDGIDRLDGGGKAGGHTVPKGTGSGSGTPGTGSTGTGRNPSGGRRG